MNKLKRIIATALMGLVLTAGSAALVYGHECKQPKSGWVDHAVGNSGIHYCIYHS